MNSLRILSKKKNGIVVGTLAFVGLICMPCFSGQYVFSVSGTKTYLNGQEILLKGFRCSNSLISDSAANDLIAHLDSFELYGLNSFSVYFQGSRYGNIPGYNQDATLNPTISARAGKIIEAADARGMVVLVGMCYYGTNNANWSNWTQPDFDRCVANTVTWAKSHNYHNVFFDPDNEGMAYQQKKYASTDSTILAGKGVDPAAVMAGYIGICPAAADLAIHICSSDPNKPYVQTEGAGKWTYGTDNYTNVGEYSASEVSSDITSSLNQLKSGQGFFLASTWLQAVSPLGPNAGFGGYGSAADPGVRWWVDTIRAKYGPYVPPPPTAVTFAPLSINGNNAFDELKLFDVRGRLLERFTFNGNTSVENIPRIKLAGPYLAVFSRNGTAVNIKRICNPAR
ncbi:MAG TPA: hypothetical protein VKF42_03220 [Chitinivibrionales bacterium]|jgi:hypothetical protein|nr:hypothetical protein [Chitinivibrionales bacterium]